jgi:hypothetical protein
MYAVSNTRLLRSDRKWGDIAISDRSYFVQFSAPGGSSGHTGCAVADLGAAQMGLGSNPTTGGGNECTILPVLEL